MAVTNQYLIYEINLNSIASVQTLQNTLHVLDGDATVVGNGIGAILAAPDVAAVKYAAPKLAPHVPFVSPSITSKWFGTEAQFPTNVATFDRKSGGWFGWSWLFGDTTHYYWRGVFNYTPAVTNGVVAAVTFRRRRWIDGFELPDQGEGAGGGGLCARAASRHVQGMGLALHHSTAPRTHATNENGDAQPDASWERFYVRVRTPPATASTLWRFKTNVSPAQGLALQMLPSGNLTVNEVDAAGLLTQVGNIAAVALDTWVRVDLVYAVAQAGQAFPKETLKVWFNGTSVFSFTDLGHNIQTNAATRHVSSELGGTVANTMAVDLDDWFCADYAAVTDGVDFQNGSAMRLVSATSLDASTTWAGDYRALNQNPADTAVASMTSSTAAAPLLVNTDAVDVISAEAQGIGMVALLVALKGTTIIAGGTLGVVGGGGELTGTLNAAVVQDASDNWMNFLYRPTPTEQALRPQLPIKLSLVHGGAGLTTVRALFGVVELLGVFGPEDAPHVVPAPKVPVRTGVHNAPYPNTPWATLTTPPIQPVYIKAGTYIGNDVGIDLNFPVPIHFLWIRPLAGDAGGAKWWSSLIGAHKGLEQQAIAAHMVHAGIDPGFVPAGLDLQQQQSTLKIVGSDTQSNASGVTYAYLAMGDPGRRFILCDALKKSVGTVTVVTSLSHAGFTPQAGFIWQEILNGSTAAGLFYKGPGHASQSLSPLGGVEVANALQFGLGQLTSLSAFHLPNANQMPCALFRDDDGSSNKGKTVQVFSYVGDGNATRVVAFTTLIGKRPLWAMVVPHNGNAIYRDPSHTGTTSTTAATGGSNAATGLIAGAVDSITVGIALNANAIVYDVLLVPGDTVAGNAGWSVLGEFMPVPPDPPPGAPTDANSVGSAEPPNAPVDDATSTRSTSIPFDPLPPAGPMPSLTDDVVAACTADTHRMINIALTRIGISKQIANVSTDAIAEAAEVRLLYNDAIQQTLRDFAWPFATRYVQMAVLNGGVRPNSDWLYAYRQPVDCIFERRIVVSRTDVANAAPVPFACSSDDTGNLIFTNLQHAVLEYTARPKCPHTRGEPLFREAAAWKLAELLAPALSRLTDTAINCAKGYAEAIGKAQLVFRPGNAGDVPPASVYDTTAVQLAANVGVVNLALIRIGARTIGNLASDQSREAQVARIIFEQELRAVLRDFPWAFATAYVTPALVGGTTAVPVNADWQYSYRLPTDTVFVRRLVDGTRRAYGRTPPTFRTALDTTGALLYTEMASTTALPVVVEYTRRPTGAVSVSDPLFKDALAWKLAWTMAPSLAQIVPEKPESVGRGPDDGAVPRERPSSAMSLRSRAAEAARQYYYFALAAATVAAANESEPDLTSTDADWVSGRD